jgi:hypothetical protein
MLKTDNYCGPHCTIDWSFFLLKVGNKIIAAQTRKLLAILLSSIWLNAVSICAYQTLTAFVNHEIISLHFLYIVICRLINKCYSEVYYQLYPFLLWFHYFHVRAAFWETGEYMIVDGPQFSLNLSGVFTFLSSRHLKLQCPELKKKYLKYFSFWVLNF